MKDVNVGLEQLEGEKLYMTFFYAQVIRKVGEILVR